MSKFHPLTIAHVRHETRDTIAVTFTVPAELRDSFQYQQGQHLTLRAQIGDEDVRRSYSICSAVQDSALRVAIKRTQGGLFSCWANDTLQAGHTIDVMPPMGHFNVPLDAANRKHYLAFAAGSGITPILSIIKTTLAAEPHSSFTLFYGNRASSSVIFKEELSDLKDVYLERLKIAYVMSREQQDIELFNGRITKDKAAQFLKYWVRAEDIDTAFICGPEDMMLGVSEALQEAGMPKASIKAELFAASIPKHAHQPRTSAAASATHQHTEVTVIMDGNAASFSMEQDKESLLDAGLRAGLDMRYSCKGGVCSTCRCKVIEGKVDMDVNYALEDYEIARGYVLSCQSFPTTAKVVIDFDQAE
ncbi:MULTISPECIES: 1,2-phenylacetyl-CoA epoxidase subunit PaaE [unclassified Duganella]|jgi:ring-1,2-phenylacetyl-CoA epoxidase subunit PaaE|uniref:1,2-phenylacetyl-CoA epoxidase subunit PaaE n=1 Tax=unclassified Duganella TaxID=2636909 RepID=UPI00088C51BF|nr:MULTISPECIES: 1,2-phenylacetyl-CoA epoxidase subunit PaaE [unclassified Duganella]SDG25264.1 ring-1,2-phenylacetyl-CoA epoxidase subunit PaaE [Duganella sp. OV458]SDJ22904.1 ring-1,2-phenylacetyl-CoA epoxidase subunit PaaE [Duganella sp. OV510]